LIIVGAVALPAASPTAAQDLLGPDPTSVAVGAANSQRYSDPRGDAGPGGLDVTTVTLSNDDAGRLRFSVAIPSHQTLPSRKGVNLAFDTDRNVNTGPLGFDYRVFVEPSGATELDKWNQSEDAWESAGESVLSPYYDRGVWAGGIRLTGLGSPSVFNFAVRTFDRLPGGGSTLNDAAPNAGLWTYRVKVGGPGPAVKRKLRIVTSVQKPKPPKAGRDFAVEVTVRRVNWSGRFNGRVDCGATIGSQLVPAGRSSVAPGRAVCRWKIPATAAGKTIRGLIEVSEDGVSATRTFSARVAAGVTLSSRGVSMSPTGGPEAGRLFYYYLGVDIREGSGIARPVTTTGRPSCSATVGGDALEVRKRELSGGVARCVWMVPAGTAGQTLVGSVVVQSKGATLRHPFKLRIR